MQEVQDFPEKSHSKGANNMTHESAEPEVSVVSDSASSIPEELRSQYGISLVPHLGCK